MSELPTYGAWWARSFKGQKLDVLKALSKGTSTSLADAARAVGVPPATARSWRRRDELFDSAVSTVQGDVAQKPVHVEPVPPSPGFSQRMLEHRVEQRREELEQRKADLRYERNRKRAHVFADVPAAERLVKLAESALMRAEMFLARPPGDSAA